MKRLWPNLGNYPGMFLEELTKNETPVRIDGVPAEIRTPPK
jgi:hypothetical protein